MARSRFRPEESWRYRVMNHYKKRAQKFLAEANTPEEKAAWQKVNDWFDSLLCLKTANMRAPIFVEKSFVLPAIEPEEIDEREKLFKESSLHAEKSTEKST